MIEIVYSLNTTLILKANTPKKNEQETNKSCFS